MHRFFVAQIKGNSAILADSVQLHHIRDVLRLKINDAVIISDGAGNEYNGVITAINKKQAMFSLTPVPIQKHSGVALTIACAIPKGSHMDEIIDGLTQLGVKRIIPMMTDRVVVKLDDAKSGSRLKRWQAIAQSAARQCQRSDIPIIAPVTDIKKVIEYRMTEVIERNTAVPFEPPEKKSGGSFFGKIRGITKKPTKEDDAEPQPQT